MKNIFPEYFVNQRDINLKDLDESVLVVLDTNVLLELYRSSASLRNELIKSINLVKHNLWMPYQVGFEFNKNRKDRLNEIEIGRKNFISNLNDNLKNTIDDTIKDFGNKYKLYEELINNSEEELNELKSTLEMNLKKVEEKIIPKDKLDFVNFVDEIYRNKVADNTSYDYLAWTKEAEKRFEDKQPPGYEDYAKKKNTFYFIKGVKLSAAYGDYFMWKEILEKAKDEKIKEVVFVTNDVKKDWFYESYGKKVGARMELIEELIRVSNASFRIYTSSTFLYHTTSENNYKIIENEVIKSERQNTSNLSELEEEAEYLLNDIYRDLNRYNNEVEKKVYTKERRPTYNKTYELIDKIGHKINEIEENFTKSQEDFLTVDEQIELIDAKEEFNARLEEYKLLRNRMMHSKKIMMENSTYQRLNNIFIDFSMINLKILNARFNHDE